MPDAVISARISARLSARIAAFRQFNRNYTRFLGTLNEGMHDTAWTLPEARVIYELATRPAPNAKEIAEALAMDAGYLSRILGKLEAAALLRRTPSKEDSRRADLTLTQQGKAVFKTLNARSDKQASEVLESLSPAAQTQLIGSMRTIESLLMREVSKGRTFTLRPHRPGDMGWIVYREAAVYNAEYGWDSSFEALAARIVADFLTSFNPHREGCWIAEIKGHHAGHIFLVQHPDRPDTAKLRLLFVDPDARGLGLGSTLVNECIRVAREAGYSKITLWTQSILVSAHRIYKAAGFGLIREEAHHSFGKDLLGQTWELMLTGHPVSQ